MTCIIPEDNASNIAKTKKANHPKLAIALKISSKNLTKNSEIFSNQERFSSFEENFSR